MDIKLLFLAIRNRTSLLSSYYLLSSEFEEVLSAYQWPFIVKTAKKPTKKDQKQQNIAEIKGKLEPLFSHLLHLQLPYPYS